MNVEHFTPDQLKAAIQAVLRRHLDLRAYRAFFFGSRIQGTGNSCSDIDVGVEGPAPLPPAVKAAIEEELARLPTLYKIDLVDFSTVSEDFRREAARSVEPMSTP